MKTERSLKGRAASAQINAEAWLSCETADLSAVFPFRSQRMPSGGQCSAHGGNCQGEAREFGGGGIADAVVLNAFPPDPAYPTR